MAPAPSARIKPGKLPPASRLPGQQRINAKACGSYGAATEARHAGGAHRDRGTQRRTRTPDTCFSKKSRLLTMHMRYHSFDSDPMAIAMAAVPQHLQEPPEFTQAVQEGA